jgi:hypothetical protein
VGLPGAIIGRSSSSAPRWRTSDGHAGFTATIGETISTPYTCHRNEGPGNKQSARTGKFGNRYPAEAHYPRPGGLIADRRRVARARPVVVLRSRHAAVTGGTRPYGPLTAWMPRPSPRSCRWSLNHGARVTGTHSGVRGAATRGANRAGRGHTGCQPSGA